MFVLTLALGCRHAPPVPVVQAPPPPPPIDPIAVEIDRARVLAEGGQVAAGVEVLRDVLRSDPDHPGAVRALADLFVGADLPGAELVAERAQALAPQAAFHNSLALRALRDGEALTAVSELRAALALDADHFGANMNLGWLALEHGDFAMARTCFERVAGTGDPDALLGLAVARRGTRDLDGAAALYAELLAADPGHTLATLDAALLEVRYRGEHDRALAILDGYTGDDPRVAELRAEVEAWKAEADARRPSVDRPGRRALQELKEALPAWNRSAGDDPCRVQLVEAAASILETRDGAMALEALQMWEACGP